MATLYKIDIYKDKEGNIEEGAFALLLLRRTIHPGVMATFLTEACEAAKVPIALDDKYKKTPTVHIWKIDMAQAKAFVAYVKSFADQDAVKAHMKALREKFPKTTPAIIDHFKNAFSEEAVEDDSLPSAHDDDDEAGVEASLLDD